MAGYSVWDRSLRNEYKMLDGRYHYLFGGGPFGSVIRYEDGTVPRNEQHTYSYRTSIADKDPNNVDAIALLSENYRQNRRPYDTGHEFWTLKVTSNATHKDFQVHGANSTFYQGPLLLNRPWASQPVYDFGPMDTVWGSQALAQSRPTKSAANLAQALGELLVDLPEIPLKAFMELTHMKHFGPAVAKEYLGYQFAWAPLVSDIQKIMRAILRSNEIISQYVRDEGRLVRRRVEGLPTTETTFDVLPNTQSNIYLGSALDPRYLSGLGFYNSLDDARGELSIRKTTTYKYWFAGAYEYKMMGEESAISSIGRIAQQADHVLGSRLDLNVLWQLAPWSWLIDWYTNIGSIIAINSSVAEDNLVIAYGYLMRTCVHIEELRHSGVTFYGGNKSGPITNTLTIERKDRIRVDPYGFAITPNAYSDTQWAILAALGLTKAPKKFWWG